MQRGPCHFVVRHLPLTLLFLYGAVTVDDLPELASRQHKMLLYLLVLELKFLNTRERGTFPKMTLTAKKKCRKFEANIPRKGISGPQSQFPHSCVCKRIMYSHDGAAVSAGGNMWTDPGNV